MSEIIASVTGQLHAALVALFGFLFIPFGDPELWERYGNRIVSGLGITIQIVIITCTIGTVLGLIASFALASGNRWLRAPFRLFSYSVRGTPLLVQLFLVYYGGLQFRGTLEALGVWWFFREAWYCVLLTYTLNTAAYQAEIFRGAIAAVPQGQWEASRALGIGRWQAVRLVILPQAMVMALRPLGNEVILMIKASALAALVTVLDLMGEARYAYSRTYDFTIYIYAAVLYLILVEITRRIWLVLERRLTRHIPDATASPPPGA
ncbi:ABC transporter permease [Pseudochelatococcus contaminans]|uniref:Polar amino acid transport system permease protein n=1 Tax=Pseudochelatococcus contaminans TaxID=1538103 RepID=A0A7W5Z233_9HYPH|nr:ABC transporter permease [Pseudochelatococcus contaminans]MBB3808673.1 polar amino acid transport system permease protein [Pseudochelatococcus contaminans]